MNNKRILFVDYEQDLVNLFNPVLRKEDYIVDAFTDSSLALSNYKPNYYDPILLDIKLPTIYELDLHKKNKKY